MLRRFGMKASVRCPVPAAAAAWRAYCMSIVVPEIAESVSSGKLMTWLKNPGDRVAEDEVLVQIESDKMTVDVRAPKEGVLTELLQPGGATVTIGMPIAKLKEGASGSGAPTKEDPAKAKVVEKGGAEAPVKPAKPVAASAADVKPAVVEVPKVIPTQVSVGGSDPRVKYVAISSMRQRIADRLKASQNTAAMLTTFNEIDMTPLVNLREKHKAEFAKRHGVKLGFMSPFIKACAQALLEVPIVNASWGQGNIEYHDYVDISVAVATKTGLVVPVLRDVQSMNFADIEKAIEDYGARAQQGKLTMAEMTGGTFTVSNGGTFGSWMGTPIINPPQSAILGMHAIKKKPWVDENDNIVVRQVMAVALTYDHRLIDGRDAVTFLVKVKNIIEDPVRLVLGLA